MAGRERRKRNGGLLGVALLAILVGLFLGVQYFGMGATNAEFVKQKLISVNLDSMWYVMLYVHIVGSMAALLLGWVQFIQRLRLRNPAMHRLIGKIYTVGVALGALSGLYLAFYAEGGVVSTLGFVGLSLAWAYTLVLGLRSIVVERDRKAHGEWMLRNYALTFAAVMLRIYLPVSMVIFGEEHFDTYYRMIAWLCWVPNLFFAQLLIGRRRRVSFSKRRAL
ncbi:DUF2306 domain-containing protein [Paenibacillus koleovorans]|uniref:DUF2306 domain-containing protein n=1 Tax=Paenibacillus koleovorans TaxID=121608 RepID=UPI0013E38A84|nr:DUF2306 domain-containing protein [Paenibacillus koleovorans]